MMGKLDHTAYVPHQKKHNVQNVHVSVYTIQKQLKYIPGKHITLRNCSSKKLALKRKKQKYFQHENTRQWNYQEMLGKITAYVALCRLYKKSHNLMALEGNSCIA